MLRHAATRTRAMNTFTTITHRHCPALRCRSGRSVAALLLGSPPGEGKSLVESAMDLVTNIASAAARAMSSHRKLSFLSWALSPASMRSGSW